MNVLVQFPTNFIIANIYTRIENPFEIGSPPVEAKLIPLGQKRGRPAPAKRGKH